MQELYTDAEIHFPSLRKMREPEFNQPIAHHMKGWKLSGDKTFHRVLDLLEVHHIGKLHINRRFVIETLPFGSMQLFGFCNWHKLNRDFTDDWLDEDRSFEINKDMCEFELFFGKEPRREVNRYMQQADGLAMQKVQLKKAISVGLMVVAVEIDRLLIAQNS